jgi:CheY-like chemotaxis protein
MSQLNAEQAPEAAPARILVVEDDPLVRFAMAEVLRDLGVSVVEATTADEAWDYLTAGAPVDLVFTDHQMPGSMSGAQLVLRINQHYPLIKTVVTSGYIDPLERPASVLNKPYDMFKTAVDLVGLAITNRQKE